MPWKLWVVVWKVVFVKGRDCYCWKSNSLVLVVGKAVRGRQDLFDGTLLTLIPSETSRVLIPSETGRVPPRTCVDFIVNGRTSNVDATHPPHGDHETSDVDAIQTLGDL